MKIRKIHRISLVWDVFVQHLSMGIIVVGECKYGEENDFMNIYSCHVSNTFINRLISKVFLARLSQWLSRSEWSSSAWLGMLCVEHSSWAKSDIVLGCADEFLSKWRAAHLALPFTSVEVPRSVGKSHEARKPRWTTIGHALLQVSINCPNMRRVE